LSLPLPFAAAIRSLDGTISTLATQSDESARVELDGQVNEFGQAKISGSINAWAPGKFTDIQMVFRNLEMNRITPYTVQFAGWKIDAGRLDLDLDYKIKGGQLNGDNAIVIREMVVGEKVENPDGTSLPLKLAVALLKDSNGVIDIDLPVSGDVNNPEFSIGGVVVKAIFNVITKVITAPFRLLGSLVGNDSEDFGTLTFDPGSAELSPPDREKLQQLESAMAQRPELALDIAGVYSPASDRAALKEIRVDEQLEARIEVGQAEGEELSTVSQRREIEAMFLEQFPDEPLETLKSRFMRTPDVNETQAADDEPAEPILDETAYVEGLRQSLIDAQEVTQQELTALADARAEAIIAALGSMQDGAPEPMVRSESVEVESEPGQPVQLELKVAVNEDAAQ